MEPHEDEDAIDHPGQSSPKVYMKKAIGTKEEVWTGVAYRTKGGLTKDDLTPSKNKRTPEKIVSKKRQDITYQIIDNAAKKAYSELINHSAPEGHIPIHTAMHVRYKRVLAPGSLTTDLEDLALSDDEELSIKKR